MVRRYIICLVGAVAASAVVGCDSIVTDAPRVLPGMIATFVVALTLTLVVTRGQRW